MLCAHLAPLEAALLASDMRETYRGQPWSQNCREWVYFDGFLDLPRIRAQFALADVVEDHTHRGTHDGQEHGLVCSLCHDAVMGLIAPAPGIPVFPPDLPAATPA